MRLFQTTTGVRIKLVVCLLGAFALMSTDKHNNHLGSVRAIIAGALYPLEYAVQVPSRSAGEILTFLSQQHALIFHNDQLKDENLLLRARLQRFQSLESENTRLRVLLDSSAKLGQRVLVSELINVDIDPFRQNLRIDKGGDDGVYVGQPVIDARGIMGQVISVTRDSSLVLLISDPNHVLPVEVLRNGLRTVAAGTGQADHLNLRYLPDHADIAVGDHIVTSGLGGRFPSDYPVAQVTAVRKVPGAPFLDVTAEPLAHLDRAREILLVWSDPATGQSVAQAPDTAAAK